MSPVNRSNAGFRGALAFAGHPIPKTVQELQYAVHKMGSWLRGDKRDVKRAGWTMLPGPTGFAAQVAYDYDKKKNPQDYEPELVADLWQQVIEAYGPHVPKGEAFFAQPAEPPKVEFSGAYCHLRLEINSWGYRD